MKQLILLLLATLASNYIVAQQNSFQEGLSWKAKGNNVEAIKFFEKAFEANPNDFAVQKEYAETNFALRRYAKAITAYEALLKDDSKNTNYLVRLAKMYSYSSKKYKSAEYAERALKLKPNQTEEIYSLANTFYFIKQYPKAISLFKQVAEAMPAAFNKMAKAYDKMHQYNSAVQVYKLIVGSKKVNGTVYYEYGNALYNNNNFDAAIKAYDLALKNNFYNEKQIHQNKALSFMAMNKFDNAIDAFLLAKQADPYNKSLNLNIVDCYIRANRFKEARTLISTLQEAMPNDAELTYSMGMSYYKEGKTSKAEKYFNEAFILNPSLKNLRYTKSNF